MSEPMTQCQRVARIVAELLSYPDAAWREKRAGLEAAIQTVDDESMAAVLSAFVEHAFSCDAHEFEGRYVDASDFSKEVNLNLTSQSCKDERQQRMTLLGYSLYFETPGSRWARSCRIIFRACSSYPLRWTPARQRACFAVLPFTRIVHMFNGVAAGFKYLGRKAIVYRRRNRWAGAPAAEPRNSPRGMHPGAVASPSEQLVPRVAQDSPRATAQRDESVTLGSICGAASRRCPRMPRGRRISPRNSPRATDSG